MIKSMPLIKRQVLILIVFSALVSVGSIIHGIFFDLALDQIKRLTIEGLIFTFLIICPSLFFLEWVFDINNEAEYEALEKRIKKLEKILERKKK